MIKLDMMDKKKQSLKEIFTEALEYYKKKDFKTTEVFCYKILSINPNHFDSLSLLSNLFAINKNFDKCILKRYKLSHFRMEISRIKF